MSQILQKFLSQFDDLTTISSISTKNSVFIAYSGERYDGRDFIPEAIKNGAAAVIYDPINFSWDEEIDLPNIAVENLKDNLSKIASIFYNSPSKKMLLTGVTGTNGKTSSVFWLAQCLNYLDDKSAFIGTIGYGDLDSFSVSINTTPDALKSQSILNQFYKDGIGNIAMEVSSHGIEQGRVSAIDFDIKLFTNLSRDHLDYHGSMENYAKVKMDFMLSSIQSKIVVNIDDNLGKLIYKKKLALSSKLSYAIDNKADIQAINIVYLEKSTKFEISYLNKKHLVESPTIGKFNIYNLLGITGCLLKVGHKIPEIVKALENLSPVPGRAEFIETKLKDFPQLIVDYAHTPDALKNILLSLKKINHKRIILVFGCGGERDKGKRKEMAKIANKFADYVIVTSDNPRNEDPIKIIEEISMYLTVKYKNIENRTKAINYAIEYSNMNDLILIAGKGHEEYQDIKNKRINFSDKKVVKECMKKLSGVKD